MTGKRVLLTINPHIYEKARQLAEDNLMTLQEFISDVLRKKVLTSKSTKNR